VLAAAVPPLAQLLAQPPQPQMQPTAAESAGPAAPAGDKSSISMRSLMIAAAANAAPVGQPQLPAADVAQTDPTPHAEGAAADAPEASSEPPSASAEVDAVAVQLDVLHALLLLLPAPEVRSPSNAVTAGGVTIPTRCPARARSPARACMLAYVQCQGLMACTAEVLEEYKYVTSCNGTGQQPGAPAGRERRRSRKARRRLAGRPARRRRLRAAGARAAGHQAGCAGAGGGRGGPGGPRVARRPSRRSTGVIQGCSWMSGTNAKRWRQAAGRAWSAADQGAGRGSLRLRKYPVCFLILRFKHWAAAWKALLSSQTF